MGADQGSIYIKKICSTPKLDDSNMQTYPQGAIAKGLKYSSA